jgi:hypothetical protein
MTTIASTAALAAVLLSTTAAQAVSMKSIPRRESAIQQIEDFTRAAKNWGFQTIDTKRLDMINDSPVSVAVRLDYGFAYAFAARCGSWCNGLRLVLKDKSGRVVKSDEINSNKPVFIFRPNEAGVYVLNLEMAGCSTGHCEVHAAILSQPERRAALSNAKWEKGP